MDECFVPDWSCPVNVRALQTTRCGGSSAAPWHSFNLAMHVGDAPEAVAANRMRLRQLLPDEPVWLNQVHGTQVVMAEAASGVPDADASWTRSLGKVCAVMTADCLPVLFCERHGRAVAAAHAGWRGLVSGVLENTLAAMRCDPQDVLVWLGPAIGPDRFEVGDEVRAAFVAADPLAAEAFVHHRGEKWLCDIYALACQRLSRAGVTAVSGGGRCTVKESERYYSYRRDGVTGRMATLIWMDAPSDGV